ncbi:putative dihydrolipoyl dehydrogenase [Helianthus anomalus]
MDRSIFILLMKPKTKFANHGIKCENAKMNLAAMMAHKDKVIFKITEGVESLFKKNKVSHVKDDWYNFIFCLILILLFIFILTHSPLLVFVCDSNQNIVRKLQIQLQFQCAKNIVRKLKN